MVSLAVWIIVTHVVGDVIAVSHRKTILWVVRISRGNEILHIHNFDVWTKPARLRITIDLNFFELAADFIHARKLLLTANSFNAFVIAPCLRITEICIPVLCDVENTICNNIYRRHCLIDCHVEPIICLILNVAIIHSLVKFVIYEHWINHLEEKHYNCRVSNQWTTTSDCSLVLAITAVVDLIRRLGANRIEVSEEWTFFCFILHLCILI